MSYTGSVAASNGQCGSTTADWQSNDLDIDQSGWSIVDGEHHLTQPVNLFFIFSVKLQRQDFSKYIRAKHHHPLVAKGVSTINSILLVEEHMSTFRWSAQITRAKNENVVSLWKNPLYKRRLAHPLNWQTCSQSQSTSALFTLVRILHAQAKPDNESVNWTLIPFDANLNVKTILKMTSEVVSWKLNLQLLTY